ncbi:MAG: peptide-methionine (S)-S-oxide reductase MsrA [Haloarculaceae archaeon]
MTDDSETATLAGGCFWCIEAAFEELDGVIDVTSGYAGGHVDDPSYEAVCRGTTGHAEAVQVGYDPDVLAYEDLLAVFFRIHDPTTKDRQGPDVGSQYRSAVYYHDEDQRGTVQRFVDDLDAGSFESYENDDIVTEIEPLERFWEAEAYHQDYYANNPNDSYCQFHAEPKVRKVREEFADTAVGQ